MIEFGLGGIGDGGGNNVGTVDILQSQKLYMLSYNPTSCYSAYLFVAVRTVSLHAQHAGRPSSVPIEE